jgi:hypothetical protein
VFPRPRAGSALTSAPLAATLLASVLLVGGLSAASPDEPTVPSEADVSTARDAAADQARTVASVQADLAVANERLRESAIAAAQATEAYNGARWELQQAQAAARDAAARERAASALLASQRASHAGSLAPS